MPTYHYGNERIARWWRWVPGLVLLAASGCTTTAPATTTAPVSDSQGARWGPLAVVDDPATGGGGAGLGPGTLQISAECVTLHTDAADGEITLLWRSAEVGTAAPRRSCSRVRPTGRCGWPTVQPSRSAARGSHIAIPHGWRS